MMLYYIHKPRAIKLPLNKKQETYNGKRKTKLRCKFCKRSCHRSGNCRKSSIQKIKTDPTF